MRDIEYEDSNLQRLLTALTPQQRRKALRGTCRRLANQTRKRAVSNLRASIRSDKDLEKGVRTVVNKKIMGFRVTVGTKFNRKSGKSRGFHKNRRGEKKPVLIWAEDGTALRNTKSRTRAFVRSRRGHSTGYMRSYGFMDKTKRQTMPGITAAYRQEITNQIVKEARKHGCT